MTKRIFLLAGILSGSLLLNGQNYLNLYVGHSYNMAKEWHRTVEAFNYARPWLNEELSSLRNGLSTGVGFTGILRKALFISPELQYNRFSTAADNSSFSTAVKLHWFRGQLNFDIYPREFKLDTVPFRVRPFVRIGGGASALLPRIRFNDSLATVNDQLYDPYVWTYHFTGGIGCRFSLNSSIDLMPVLLFNYHPFIVLEDFNLALHGTSVPGLRNDAPVSHFQALFSIAFRVGRKKDPGENKQRK